MYIRTTNTIKLLIWSPARSNSITLSFTKIKAQLTLFQKKVLNDEDISSQQYHNFNYNFPCYKRIYMHVHICNFLFQSQLATNRYNISDCKIVCHKSFTKWNILSAIHDFNELINIAYNAKIRSSLKFLLNIPYCLSLKSRSLRDL